MFMYSFNPYCSGRWSRTQRKVYNRRRARVLILIVVEDGLVQIMKDFKVTAESVLILIVVEDGLVLDLIRLF